MTASAPQSRDLAQRLQHAADLLNTGRPADARLAAERVLETHPDHPLALYLLGGAAKLEGHFRAAERSYRKALEIDPTQPQVRLALAKALHADGRLAAAIAELKRATEDQPRYLAAWLELGDRLLGSGDPEAAVEAFSAALRLKPGSPSAETGLARARLASGDVETARAALEDIVRREPNRVASRFYLGRARRLDGEPEAAVAALGPLVSQNDAAAEALQEAARAAYEAGDEDGALRLLERAAASAPYAAGVHRDLAQIRFMTGRDDALASFERVLDAGRAPPELLSAYVATAIAVDASDPAARRFERALGETEHPVLRDAEGRLALARGRAADAVASFRRAVAADPANAIYVQNLAAALLEAGDPKAAVETCERALAAAPYDQALLAYIVTGQMMLGDATAGGLVDLETFTRRIEVSPPAGHATIEAFNAALAEELGRLHRAKRRPIDQSLRGGVQVELSARVRRNPVVAALAGQLKAAVADFIGSLPNDPDHPFLSRAPSDVQFSGFWSVRLSSGGSHVSHIHPQGWLSSAYYVRLPDEIPDAASGEGWLYLGAPPMPTNPAIEPLLIEPRAGSLILFPSYLWHGVRPFRSETPRVTAAFDVRAGSGSPEGR